MTDDKGKKLGAGYQPVEKNFQSQIKEFNNQFTSGYQPIGEGFKAQGINMANLPKDGTGVPPKPKDK